jgi:UDP-N-acetylmuramate dehydrogenase
MKIEYDYNIKHLNSFKLYSTVGKLYFPESLDDLQKIYTKDIPILAGGTNIIFQPEVSELICLNNMPKRRTILCNNEIQVTANYNIAKFIKEMCDLGIGGFEHMWGIPGTIGGAVVMNAGSSGHSISENIKLVQVLLPNGKLKTYTKKQLKFKRRYSILQDKKCILLSVVFSIPENQTDFILLEKIKQNRKSIPSQPSCGGFFVNWHELKPYAKELLTLKVGGVEVSNSINIIVNTGNAKFEDVISILTKIDRIVKKPLTLEVKFI